MGQSLSVACFMQMAVVAPASLPAKYLCSDIPADSLTGWNAGGGGVGCDTSYTRAAGEGMYFYPPDGSVWNAQGGTFYPKGLYMHQAGDATFTITGHGGDRVMACMGVATEKDQASAKDCSNSWTFTVYGDGAQIGQYSVLRCNQCAVLDLDIQGIDVLRFTTSGPQGFGGTAWGNLRIVAKETSTNTTLTTNSTTKTSTSITSTTSSSVGIETPNDKDDGRDKNATNDKNKKQDSALIGAAAASTPIVLTPIVISILSGAF